MNRGNQFIIGAVAAVLTFATLTLTLGERHRGHWGEHGFRHGYHHHDGSHDHHDEHNDKSENDSSQNSL